MKIQERETINSLEFISHKRYSLQVFGGIDGVFDRYDYCIGIFFSRFSFTPSTHRYELSLKEIQFPLGEKIGLDKLLPLLRSCLVKSF